MRLLHESMRKVTANLDFSFFKRCASSMTIYLQWNFFSADFSLITISYDVTQTSNIPGRIEFLICSSRASRLPWNLNTLKTGHHLLNSFIQLPSVDFGTTTKCGPVMPRYSCKYPKSEIVWSVFPKPISSAKIPLMPWSNSLIIQFKPSIWYCLIVPNLMHDGCTVNLVPWKWSSFSTISLSSSSSSMVSFLAFFPFFSFAAWDFDPARKWANTSVSAKSTLYFEFLFPSFATLAFCSLRTRSSSSCCCFFSSRKRAFSAFAAASFEGVIGDMISPSLA